MNFVSSSTVAQFLSSSKYISSTFNDLALPTAVDLLNIFKNALNKSL